MGRRLGSIFLRQTSRTGSFAAVCFINMLLNFRWSIPAWLILAAHFMFGIPPLWVFGVVLALWPIAAILMTAIMRLLRRLAFMSGGYSHGGGTVVHVDESTPNKNPYSATQRKEEKVKANFSRITQFEGKDYYAEYTNFPEYAQEMSGGNPPSEDPAQPVSYPEVEGKDWYAEYRQSEESKKEVSQAAETGRKSEF